MFTITKCLDFTKQVLFFNKKNWIFEENNINYRVECERAYYYASNNLECNSSSQNSPLSLKCAFVLTEYSLGLILFSSSKN